MAFGMANYGIGFLAGGLSTLSPCVLPLVPILIGSAGNAHPKAPFALAAGLALSYAVVGTLLAWAGSALNLDGDGFRIAGAVLLGLFGLLLLSSRLQHRFATGASPLSHVGHALMARIQPDSLKGQLGIGVLLGLVWSPCAGPTLGAAVMLASQGEHLTQVAVLMGLFGAGAALPIAALAMPRARPWAECVTSCCGRAKPVRP